MFELKHGETVIETVLPGTYVRVPGLGHVRAEPGWTHGEYSIVVAAPIPPPPPPPLSDQDIDLERDRRIDGGFTFGGVMFQSRPEDRENIAGAAQLATIALTLGGKLPEDFYWHDGADPFAWIAEDNSLNPMDAPTVIAFAQAAATHRHAHIFAARIIKDMDPLPEDHATNPAYWP